jgi:uncharacterized membrane-anchored protein
MRYSNTTKSKTKQLLIKVPQITAMFWIIKILTTGMGEATSDALVNAIGPGFAAPLVFIVFLLALRWQLKAERYQPWTYWFCVVMVAVFGTMAADGIHIIGVPYIITSSMYAIILVLVFYFWRKKEGTLSIHSIYTNSREKFYWLTILATFALGTAIGDLTATTFNLGFFHSGLMFIGIILIPAILHFVFKVNEIFTFWFAYVITRPLGASFADYFGKPKNIGGLNLKDSHVSLVLSALIIILVGYLSYTHKDTPKPEPETTSS